MNTQKPEPLVKGSDGTSLDFHSMFFTIQGEGPFAGHRSIFVRLAGCNLQCPGCDTEYTYGRREVAITRMVDELQTIATRKGIHGNLVHDFLVVITGGEPLRQPIGPFVKDLLDIGYKVQIESNGLLGPDDMLKQQLRYRNDRLKLVVSPKTSRVHEDTAKLASAYKYVLDHESVDPVDGLPIKALEHPASTGVARPPRWYDPFADDVPIYLNPFDAQDPVRNAANLQAVAESCMEHGYILGVQLHKLIGLE